MITEEQDVAKLTKRIGKAFKDLATMRTMHTKTLKEITGTEYSDATIHSPGPRPVPFMELARAVYLSTLSPTNPAVSMDTKDRNLRPVVHGFAVHLQECLEAMRFEDEMGVIVTNAMHSLGIAKVGIDNSHEVAFGDTIMPVGRTYCRSISPFRWFHDTHVERYHDIRFAGHFFKLPLDYVKSCGLYDNTETLRPDTDEDQSRVLSDEELVEKMINETPSSANTDFSSLEHMGDTTLIYVWLPRSKQILTLSPYTKKPLRSERWHGPAAGPFRLLRFTRITDRIVPMPPMALLRDLSEFANELYKRMQTQVRKLKRLTLYRNEADGARIKDASDGEYAQGDPSNTKEVKVGGVDPTVLQTYLKTEDLISYFGRNIDLQGGLSAQSPTARQDMLLKAGGSQLMGLMLDRVTDFVTGVATDIGEWEWTDGLSEYPIVRHFAGLELPMTLTPEMRDAEYYTLMLDVVVHGTLDKSPNARLQRLSQVLQSLILPALPLLQQMGTTQKFIEYISSAAALPELAEMFPIEDMRPPETAETQKQSPVTSRENVRVNQNAEGRGRTNQALIQSLAGKE